MSKPIEQKYQKLDEISHVLHRPGMYIGSTAPHKEEGFIFNETLNMMEKVSLEYNPGFLKLFDEIISNSVDESKRVDALLDTIKVNIDQESGEISVWDNGGIPVEIHKEHGVYVPELIFGNLRAGSNFDDTEDRTLVGTNGVGAALVSIFSEYFKVETCDGTNKFSMKWENNMRSVGTPRISLSSTRYTKITFLPDYKKLGTTLTDANYHKLIRKIYDVAGCNDKLKVYLNGNKIKISNFKDYIKLYTDDYIYDENENWKVGISKSEDDFTHVSFVNGVETNDVTSTNVTYITDQLCDKLKDYFKSKHKVTVRASDIKNHLKLFIYATVVNPKYSSQTKEKLITEPKSFKTEFEISDKLIAKLVKSDIIENILNWVMAKELAKERAKLKNINKKTKIRVDNYLPPTENNKYLVLCEGLSATGGLSKVLSRKDFGFFSLRGKPLNSLEVSVNRIISNKEIESIVNILNLDLSILNNTIDFESVLFATDMDLDGISICGLLLTFFYRFTPEIIKRGKICRLKTPLITAKKNGKFIKYFFDLEEYNMFMQTNTIKYDYQYYKGLGSWTEADLRFIISEFGLDSFIEPLEWSDDVNDIINNWLGKGNSDYRKEALRAKQFNIEVV